MLHEKTSRGSKLFAAAVLVAYLIVCHRAMQDHDQMDFAVYRAGAQLALNGHSPYQPALVQLKALQQVPPKPDQAPPTEGGCFLAPQAFLMLAPIARNESWDGAQSLWFCILSVFGFACGTLAWTFGRGPERQGAGWALVILLVLINPVTIAALKVGQTGLLFAGLIALGQYAFESGSPRFGCFLWALAFFKPQLAVPFLVLAWALGGWKRAAGIAAFVTALNLLGALMVRWDFWDALRLCRQSVGAINTAADLMPVASRHDLLGWNRALAVLGGPAIDLRAWMVLAGLALWGLMIWGRSWLGGMSLSDPAYLLAVSTTGALFFTQSHEHEAVLLALLAPLVLRHFDDHRKAEAWLLIGLLAVLSVPTGVMEQVAERLKLGESSRGHALLGSHRCLGVAVLALYLLIRGQPRRPSPSSSTSPAALSPAPPLPA